jgi:fructoselysine-6-P-deglycase FrlB-like protein/predicted NBD/HSP70 family sugar kinase
VTLKTEQATLLGSQTYREVMHQPDVWLTAARELPALVTDLRDWIRARGYDEVWFCGAGTSAFIGESLSAHLNERRSPTRYLAVPTTELVAHPHRLLLPGARRLLVSFGRSGESPETLATLALLERTDASALHITCNADGALARSAGPRQRALVLPPETHDAGFAMTSSYSTMLLYALACFDDLPVAQIAPRLQAIAAAGRGVLDAAGRIAAQLPPPQRVAFLGSGELGGAARESALKVLELTAGRVAAFWDSPLGFRHGPKSLVNDDTRIVVLLSPDPDARRYDVDVVAELRSQYDPGRVITVGTEVDSGTGNGGADIAFASIPAGWNVPLHVLPAQVIAVTWSDRMGLNVDDPFPGGQLSRVVHGVRLYPPSIRRARLYGGMDVGGSKIETCLFDERFQPLERRRVDTACTTYEELLDCIVGEAHWLETCAGSPVDLGIGLPGLVDHVTGCSLTSNLPATGKPLRKDLVARLGRTIAMANDCKCFALSEANGGAGDDAGTTLGLILGTGLAGGVTYRGRLVLGYNDLPGEVGHIGIPARYAEEWNLPILPCGCGRVGCYETLVSGPGLTRLAVRYHPAVRSPAEIACLAQGGDAAMAAAVREWLTLLAELIHTAQCTIDMDCVVLGGGLSRIPNVAQMLAQTYRSHQLVGRAPRFTVARFGDASGARGAALLLAQS